MHKLQKKVHWLYTCLSKSILAVLYRLLYVFVNTLDYSFSYYEQPTTTKKFLASYAESRTALLLSVCASHAYSQMQLLLLPKFHLHAKYLWCKLPIT